VRRLIAGWCLLALTVACAHARPSPPRTPLPFATQPAAGAPYEVVGSGDVEATVPKKWQAAGLSGDGSLRQGLVASPDPARWDDMDGSVPGIEVAWVDANRVGVPSDLYYLAAAGPAVPRLVSSSTCHRVHVHVVVNHKPFAGDPFSPADYVERGSGTCHRPGNNTRWAYFVAAPGFGPLRDLGIRTSGLYVALAVVPDSPTAEKRLQTMLRSAQYGSATVAQLLAAAKVSARLT
jgi:hypothetical protein